MSFVFNSLDQVQKDLFEGKISCYEIVLHYLSQIESKKDLNAFLEVFSEDALKKAEDLDKKIKLNQQVGKLAGLILAVKDVICIKDKKVSASSLILENFTSLYSATAIQRLIDEDVIIIGRTNCDEFAMGSSNENSAFGNVLNDFDHSLVPGGSSGGSAVAVQAGLCMAALGTDTGGSIRQPASFTGTIGFKPSYGRVSRYGLIAYASSFDQIGTFTINTKDASRLLEVMAGPDEKDATTSHHPIDKYSLGLDQLKNKKLKFAFYDQAINHSKLDAEIQKQIVQTFEQLKHEGHQVDSKELKYLDYLVATYYVLTTAEASSNLSRFAGVQYGYRDKEATSLESVFTSSRSKGFGKEVKRRIMLGTFVLSAGYYDAYYTHAQKVRRIIQQETEEILKEYDFILLPTTPTTAFQIGGIKDPIEMYLADIFTVQANIAGLPAISVPLYRHHNGMPFGLQIIGKRYNEGALLAVTNHLLSKS